MLAAIDDSKLEEDDVQTGTLGKELLERVMAKYILKPNSHFAWNRETLPSDVKNKGYQTQIGNPTFFVCGSLQTPRFLRKSDDRIICICTKGDCNTRLEVDRETSEYELFGPCLHEEIDEENARSWTEKETTLSQSLEAAQNAMATDETFPAVEVKMEDPDEEEEMLKEDDGRAMTGFYEMMAQMEEDNKADDKMDEMAAKALEEMPGARYIKQRGRPRKNPADPVEQAKRKKNQHAEYLQKEKTEVSTFGLSARPRRSVNYANLQGIVGEVPEKIKRRKRVREERDSSYEDSDAPSTSKVQNNYKKAVTPLAISQLKLYKPTLTNELTQYMDIVPNQKSSQPLETERQFMTRIDILAAVQSASGGFRRFIAWISDSKMMELYQIVEKTYTFANATEEEELAKTLRHVWHTMSIQYRMHWELAARNDAVDGAGENDIVTIPPNEIPLETKEDMKRRMSRRPNNLTVHCCDAIPTFTSIIDVIKHFAGEHDSVMLYGCHFCNVLFPTEHELKTHLNCKFSAYLLEKAMAGQKVEMTSSYMFVSCVDCGLWLPLRTKVTGQRCWPYFCAAMEAHSCKTIVPVLLHFTEHLSENNALRFTLSVFPRLECGIETSCQECSVEFNNVSSADQHFKTAHPDKVLKCTRCQEEFGTQFTYRLHIVKHFNDSLILGNYLRFSATYIPPPHSERLPHVGLDKTNVVIGGFDCAMAVRPQHAVIEEFVGKDEDATIQKLRNCAHSHIKKLKNAEGDENQENRKVSSMKQKSTKVVSRRSSPVNDVRPDLGYEHIDYELLDDMSTDETVAKKLLKTVIAPGHDDEFLERGQLLLDAEQTCQMLQNVNGAEVAVLSGLANTMADEMAEAYVRNLVLPLSACIDPLKDFLLINRKFHFCDKCDHLFCSDPIEHTIKCAAGGDITLTRELFCPSQDPSTGIACVDANCRVRLCSVISLRCHAALVHGKFINFDPSPADGRYDYSISGMIRLHDKIRSDTRGRMARFTDVELGMPYGGLLDKKFPEKLLPVRMFPVNVQAPLSAPRPQQIVRPIMPRTQISHAVPLQPMRDRPLEPIRRDAFDMQSVALDTAIRAANSQLTAKTTNGQAPPVMRSDGKSLPYVTPKMDFYLCRFCNYKCRDLSAFQMHIRKAHNLLCRSCGYAYATTEYLRAHRNSCGKQLDRLDSNVTVKCELCSGRYPLLAFHAHILKQHFSNILISDSTGELFPRGVELSGRVAASMRNNEQANNLLALTDGNRVPNFQGQTNAVSVVNKMDQLFPVAQPPGSVLYSPPPLITKKGCDLRMTCYLCEMTMETTQELDAHLEKHPEKWNNCPFCLTAVRGHYDMQKHLLQTHLRRSALNMMCVFCNMIVNRSPCSHLIYQCKKMPRCGICCKQVINYEQLIEHFANEHMESLKRFQCTFCALMFISMTEFTDHVCKIPSKMQTCACNSYNMFDSIPDFCNHFDETHIENDNRCGICKMKLGSMSQLARHRLNHMRQVSPSTFRKVYVLPAWLHPPEKKTTVSSWGRVTATGSTPGTRMIAKKAENGMMIVAGTPTSNNPANKSGMQLQPTQFRLQLNGNDSSKSVAPSPVRQAGQQPGQGMRVVMAPSKTNGVDVAKEEVKDVDDVAPGLMDDDDDDICVIEYDGKSGSNGNGQKKTENEEGKSRNGKKDSSPDVFESDRPPPLIEDSSVKESLVSAPVRVETSDGDTAGGQGQPGYVDEGDDDIEIVGTKTEELLTAVAVSAKVKEVVDDDGDDELAVVAEVENAAGVLSSTISATSREKRFKCNKCSSAFFTQNSLRLHLTESHRTDAGSSTSQETFGIPEHIEAAICRNCCLVFESRTKFYAHMNVHGQTQFPCRECSGISFNASMAAQHEKGHKAGSVFYACGVCLKRFSSDVQLAEHSSTEHGIPLFFFCKLCSYGSCNLDNVFEHVIKVNHPNDGYTFLERIGVCPCALLNFEPTDAEKYKAKLQNGQIKCYRPSDCSHRSLLLSSEAVVTCRDCHCNQPVAMFLSLHRPTDGSETFTFTTAESRDAMYKKFPFAQFLSRENYSVLKMANNSGHMTLRDVFHMNRRVPTVPIRTERPVVPAINSRPHMLRQTLPPGRSPTSVVRPNNSTEYARLPAMVPDIDNTIVEVINTTPHQQHNNMDKSCRICNATLSTAYDTRKHRMHKMVENKWFCLECAESENTEMKMMIHYYRNHLVEASKRVANDFSIENWRALTFELRCPFSQCKGAFQSLKAFEKHLAAHTDLLPYPANYCDAHFATSESRDEHDEKHVSYEAQNGVEANCCTLCGTTDMWTLPKDTDMMCVVSHVARHGLEHFSMCRVCFVRFPDDNQFTQLQHHFKMVHTKTNPSGTVTCNVCNIELEAQIMVEHCHQKHCMHTVKKSSGSKHGELVVRSGSTLINYLDIRRTHPSESSPRPDS